MKDKNLGELSVSELLAELDWLFYRSTETHYNRRVYANRIMDELKIRFRETGI